jgi:alpha-tubulin suppressor-like RCC1 family protein
MGDSPFPLPVSGLTGVTAIAAGSEHCLALKNDGTVVEWGTNLYNQLGNPDMLFTSVPTTVQGLKGVTAISAGWAHNIVLLTNGTAWLWGNNEVNELGILYIEIQPTPVVISR